MTNEEVFICAYDEVRLRGLSPKTVESYLGRLKLFLKYYNNRPIEEMGEIEIREYLLYLLDSGHRPGSVNISNSALRFIFGAVMGRNLNYQLIHRRREYRAFPALMSKNELSHFFSSMDNLRDKAMFETAYGAGLRLSEIAHLRVQDIDSEQMRIFVHHGKGGKDRYRKHKTLEGCPELSAVAIGKLQASMASDWRKDPVPYPSFHLANNNANIRRVRQRIDDLKNRSEFAGWTFPSGEAKINEGENRLQLLFDEKPSEEQRHALKGEGFKWAPSQGAWQRQLNQNAIRAADRLDFLRPEDGGRVRDLQPYAHKTAPDRGER